MQTAKKDAEALIRSLPEDATIEDMQYRLYVLEQIREGVRSVETEGGVAHDDAKKRMARWLQD